MVQVKKCNPCWSRILYLTLISLVVWLFKVMLKHPIMQVGNALRSVSWLPAQPAGILGTRPKASRQRALGLGWGSFALAGDKGERLSEVESGV